MRILLAHGPNLSQLGSRNPEVYGTATLADIVEAVRESAEVVDDFTSEYEGALIERLHAARQDGTEGVIINPGALTHYSYALRDALELLDVPVVEVHISNIAKREPFRQVSVVSAVVDITISGAGVLGYQLAVQAIRELVGPSE